MWFETTTTNTDKPVIQPVKTYLQSPKDKSGTIVQESLRKPFALASLTIPTIVILWMSQLLQ